MKISEIKELIQLISDSEINEMELQKEEVRLILRKVGTTPIQTVQYQAASLPAPASIPAAVAPSAARMTPAPQAEVLLTIPGKSVKAPMVGTFYRASRPDAAPFVNIGDKVKEGQSLCIIEAMKLMNQIEAEFSGTVMDILVKDGQPVEYGQTIFIIDPDK